ncbi:LysR substrate-binding domain-containing protein [Amycolatopsis jiangsuensis]|uniref:DNA-binding transcriptional LysR family regulator n=1 Tax=Amycolatopsis jiangsuensis TaxID=1181879 RepID=A0A840J4S7_9PSEU|nr:LysR substrate-binding domain-containing protein [Amycolatopsis jiangsuensis]MBB4688354.1 DNA-binding transcriptional LysR family regulator [Amycolatopsis jiangsuensis]
MTSAERPPAFRLAYVPGATPAKWVRIWGEREPRVSLELVAVSAAEAADAVREDRADAALLRLPGDRDGLHAIPLYTETTVVVAPKDHLIAAADEVSGVDLADDVVLHPLDDPFDWPTPPGRPPGLPARERPATTGDAIELVAAGVGLLVVPQSLARLHHRRDLTYRTLTDAPQSCVALSWPEGETSALVEQFIGIVRGRTVNSTRGQQEAKAKGGTPARTPAKPTREPSRRRGAPKPGRSRRHR